MTTICSSIMFINIRPGVVEYGFLNAPGVRYEIRGVSFGCLAILEEAEGHRQWSRSRIVQYLTHLYASTHYRNDGRRAPPSPQSKASLASRIPAARLEAAR